MHKFNNSDKTHHNMVKLSFIYCHLRQTPVWRPLFPGCRG